MQGFSPGAGLHDYCRPRAREWRPLGCMNAGYPKHSHASVLSQKSA
jgi:hypothetical protein